MTPQSRQRQHGHAGRHEAKDLTVKRQLGFEAGNHRLGLAKPVLLTGESQIRMRNPLCHHGIAKEFGLRRRHDSVFKALQQQHRARQVVNVRQRRALDVEIARFW